MIVDSAGIWGYNLGKQKRYIVGGLPIRLIVVIIEAGIFKWIDPAPLRAFMEARMLPL